MLRIIKCFSEIVFLRNITLCCMMYIELPIKMYMYNKNDSNTRVAFNCFVFFNKFKEN